MAQKKNFWAADLTVSSSSAKNAFYQVKAEKRAVGGRCVVWAAVDQNVSTEDCDEVASKFDGIYSKITDVFGSAEYVDVDGDGKVTLLLLDIKDGSTDPSQGYTAGFFDARMLYNDATFHTYVNKYADSNVCDMLYIDTYGILNDDGRGTYATAAHEFQHLINYSVLVKKYDEGLTERAVDTWLNEGLSTAAEFIFEETSGEMGDGYNKIDKSLGGTYGDPCDRIQYYNLITGGLARFYNKSDWDYLDDTALGDNFYVWDSGLTDYSTAYLFFQWLRIQSGGGTGIYTEIINSDYGDYNAVLNAARQRISGLASSSFPDVIKTWLLATLKNEDTGLEGYNGKIETYPYKFNKEDWWAEESGNRYHPTVIYLYPLEGIFSDYFASGNEGADVVKYDTESTNAAYLVLNRDDDLKDSYEYSGTIAASEFAGVSLDIRPARQRAASSARQAAPFGKKFPVDVVLPVPPLESLPGLLKVPAGE